MIELIDWIDSAENEGNEEVAALVDQSLNVVELILRDDKYRAKFKESPELLEHLVHLLDKVDGNDGKKTLVQVLSSVGTDAESKIEIGKQDGFRKLLKLLVDGDEELRQQILLTLQLFLEAQSSKLDTTSSTLPAGGIGTPSEAFSREHVDANPVGVGASEGTQAAATEVDAEALAGTSNPQAAANKTTPAMSLTTKISGVVSQVSRLALTVFPSNNKTDDEKSADENAGGNRAGRPKPLRLYDGGVVMSSSGSLSLNKNEVTRVLKHLRKEKALQNARDKATTNKGGTGIDEDQVDDQDSLLKELIRVQGGLSALTQILSSAAVGVQIGLLTTLSKLLLRNRRNQSEFHSIQGYSIILGIADGFTSYSDPEVAAFLKSCFDVLYLLVLDESDDRTISNTNALDAIVHTIANAVHLPVRLEALICIQRLLLANCINSVHLYALGAWHDLIRTVEVYAHSGAIPSPESVLFMREIMTCIQFAAVMLVNHNTSLVWDYIRVLKSHAYVDHVARDVLQRSLLSILYHFAAYKYDSVHGIVRTVTDLVTDVRTRLSDAYCGDLSPLASSQEHKMRESERFDGDSASYTSLNGPLSPSLGQDSSKGDALQTLELLACTLFADRDLTPKRLSEFLEVDGYELLVSFVEPETHWEISEAVLWILEQICLCDQCPESLTHKLCEVYCSQFSAISSSRFLCVLLNSLHSLLCSAAKLGSSQGLHYKSLLGRKGIVQCLISLLVDTRVEVPVKRLVVVVLGEFLVGCHENVEQLEDMVGLVELAELFHTCGLELSLFVFDWCFMVSTVSEASIDESGAPSTVFDRAVCERSYQKAYTSLLGRSGPNTILMEHYCSNPPKFQVKPPSDDPHVSTAVNFPASVASSPSSVSRSISSSAAGLNPVSVMDSSAAVSSELGMATPRSTTSYTSNHTNNSEGEDSATAFVSGGHASSNTPLVDAPHVRSASSSISSASGPALALGPDSHLHTLTHINEKFERLQSRFKLSKSFVHESSGPKTPRRMDQTPAVSRWPQIPHAMDTVWTRFRSTESSLLVLLLLPHTDAHTQIAVLQTLLTLVDTNPANKRILYDVGVLSTLLRIYPNLEPDTQPYYLDLIAAIGAYDVSAMEILLMFELNTLLPNAHQNHLSNGGGVQSDTLQLHLLVLLEQIAARDAPLSFFNFSGFRSYITSPPIPKLPSGKVGYTVTSIFCMNALPDGAANVFVLRSNKGDLDMRFTVRACPDENSSLDPGMELAQLCIERDADVYVIETAKVPCGRWLHTLISHDKTHLSVWLNGVLCFRTGEIEYLFDSKKSSPYVCEVGSPESSFCGSFGTLMLLEGILTDEQAVQVFQNRVLYSQDFKMMGLSKRRLFTLDPREFTPFHFFMSESSAAASTSARSPKTPPLSVESSGSPTATNMLSTSLLGASLSPLQDRHRSHNFSQKHRRSHSTSPARQGLRAPANHKRTPAPIRAQYHSLCFGGLIDAHNTRSMRDEINQIGGVRLCLPLIAMDDPQRVAGLRILAAILRRNRNGLDQFLRENGFSTIGYLLSRSPVSLDCFEQLFDLICGCSGHDVVVGRFKHVEGLHVVLDLLRSADSATREQVLFLLSSMFSREHSPHGDANCETWLSSEGPGILSILELVRFSPEHVSAVMSIMKHLFMFCSFKDVETFLRFVAADEHDLINEKAALFHVLALRTSHTRRLVDFFWKAGGYDLMFVLLRSPCELLRADVVRVIGLLYETSSKFSSVFLRMGGFKVLAEVLSSHAFMGEASCSTLLRMGVGSLLEKETEISASETSVSTSAAETETEKLELLMQMSTLQVPESLSVLLLSLASTADPQVHVYSLGMLIHLLNDEESVATLLDYKWRRYMGMYVEAVQDRSGFEEVLSLFGDVCERILVADLNRPVKQCQLWKVCEMVDTPFFQNLLLERMVAFFEKHPIVDERNALCILRNLVQVLEQFQKVQPISPNVATRLIATINFMASQNSHKVRTLMKSQGMFGVREALVLRCVRADMSVEQRVELFRSLSFECIPPSGRFRDAQGTLFLLVMFHTTEDTNLKVVLMNILRTQLGENEEHRRFIVKLINDQVAASVLFPEIKGSEQLTNCFPLFDGATSVDDEKMDPIVPTGTDGDDDGDGVSSKHAKAADGSPAMGSSSPTDENSGLRTRRLSDASVVRWYTSEDNSERRASIQARLEKAFVSASNSYTKFQTKALLKAQKLLKQRQEKSAKLEAARKKLAAECSDRGDQWVEKSCKELTLQLQKFVESRLSRGEEGEDLWANAKLTILKEERSSPLVVPIQSRLPGTSIASDGSVLDSSASADALVSSSELSPMTAASLVPAIVSDTEFAREMYLDVEEDKSTTISATSLSLSATPAAADPAATPASATDATAAPETHQSEIDNMYTEKGMWRSFDHAPMICPVCSVPFPTPWEGVCHLRSEHQEESSV